LNTRIQIWIEGARDSTSVDALVSVRQGRRLVKKSRIIDLRNKKVCHIGARDESGGPVARIGPDAICPRARSIGQNSRTNNRVSELETYFRQIYKPFGYLTNAQWHRLTETSARRLPDGGITTHYDPKIVLHFELHPNDTDQWPQWDALDCEVLCLRGAQSDVLLPETAQAMTRRGPWCRLVTIEGCGHTPALNVPEQIKLVVDFLSAPSESPQQQAGSTRVNVRFRSSAAQPITSTDQCPLLLAPIADIRR
jgi:hypothetical protein